MEKNIYFVLALFVCDVEGVTIDHKLGHLQLDVDYLRYQARAFKSKLKKLEESVEENVIRLNIAVDDKIKEKLDIAGRQVRELQVSAVKQGPWTSYRNSYYRHVNTRMNKMEAGMTCLRYGASIVEVNDAKEMDFLVKAFGSEESFWIEGSDKDKEAEWRLPSGQLLPYQNWADHEPSSLSLAGIDENCIEGGGLTWNTTWNDAPCDNVAEYWQLPNVVCEFAV